MKSQKLRELVANIKERFQLAILMSIFFPSLLATYFTATKTPQDQIASITLSWSILIVIYLISYVLFDGGDKSDMREGVLAWLNWMTLIGIVFFVYPILYLVVFGHPTTPVTGSSWAIHFDIGSFFVSLWGMQIIPAFVLGLSILSVVWKKK